MKKIKILINAGTHGDEKIGERVYKKIIKNGSIPNLFFSIANKKAYERNVRYIDTDLNRSFPGKKNGNYEERLAYDLEKVIRKMDIVIDIHSTKSELRDALIVTKLNQKTKEYIKVINPKKVLIMSVTKGNALISNAKIGLAFEYGKDNNKVVIDNIAQDINKLIEYLNLKSKNVTKKIKKSQTKYFNVTKIISKPKGYKLCLNVKNYSLIKKNQVYAKYRNKKLIARNDFYPILFGNNNYEDIFGFGGKKIES